METIELIHGDCLEKMQGIESNSIDAVIADPPYGTTNCKWDSIIPLDPMWEQLKRVIKPDGAIIINAQQPFTSALIMSNPRMFKYEWIWEKDRATGHLNAKKQPMRAHESVVIFYKKQVEYIPQMVDGEKPSNKSAKTVRNSKTDNYGRFKEYQRGGSKLRYPRTVLKFNTVNSAHGVVHPTQKPLKLIEYLVQTYTKEDQTILDFTMGSGTTGVACKKLGRNFIGIELEEKYFNIASERISAC